MKKLALLATSTMLTLTIAVPALAQSAADQYGEDTVQGYILHIFEGGIRVGEHPSLGAEDPDFCETTYDFTTTDGTEILRQQNGQLVQASVDDFRVGQSVKVTYSYPPDGAVPAICPIPLTADKIIILGENPDVPGGNEKPPDEESNPPDKDSSNSNTAPTLLPDTGGITLPVAGAAVLMVVGGLVARRLSR